MDIDDVLDIVKTALSNRHGIDAAIRYTKAEELGDVGDGPQYYVEPGGFEVERRNVGAARQIFRTRATSAEWVSTADYENAAKTRANQWSDVAFDFVSRPMLTHSAFVRTATTYPDAPAGYSAEALGDGVTVLNAGIEITIVID